MLTFDSQTRIVTLNLVDLEHCGFEHDAFDFELGSAGIQDKPARWPLALLVNFAGGHVITPNTSAGTLAALKESERAFAQLRADLHEAALLRKACRAARQFVEGELEQLRREMLDAATPIPQDELLARAQVLSDLARQLDTALNEEHWLSSD